jgi:phospholipid N-methyltransferase
VRVRAATHRLRYLLQFLRNPRELGSITPSSRFLARALLGELELDRAHQLVELGPGTGVFTREALRLLDRDARLLALDTNAEFVELLRKDLNDPRLAVVRASAEQVAEQVAAQGWEHVDAVISGIPYSLLPRHITAGIVHSSWRALRPGGLFVAYQYSPYLRPFLRGAFGNCRLKLVLRNVPPAVVFVSRKRVGDPR